MKLPFSITAPRGALAKHTLHATVFNGLRLISQTLSLVLLARVIGPAELGKWMGVAGVAAVLGAFSGLGLSLVMYQEGAVKRSALGSYWRLSLTTILISGSFLVVFGSVVTLWLFGGELPLLTAVTILLADVVFLPLNASAANALAACEKIGWASGLALAMAIARLAGVLLFWSSDVSTTVESYSIFYFCGTIVAAGFGLRVVKRICSLSSHDTLSVADEIWRGLGFLATWASGTALGSVDKAVVLRYAGAETAGVYGPAYRAATLFAFPAESMSMAAMPRLFQKYAGAREHRGLVPWLFVLTAGYGVLAGACLWAAAPLLPLVLGDKFAEVMQVVRWLALFVPCYALRTLGGVVLLAGGRTTRRAVIETAGSVIMFTLGAMFMSRGDYVFAAIIVTMIEALIAVVHWSAVLRGGVNKLKVDQALQRAAGAGLGDH